METTVLADAGAASRTSDYTDDVLPALFEWTKRGERCALVTLIGVDGNAPRAEGAQMAVSESGQWAGYISGGCLESAIALEAADVIKTGRHRLIRYGKGSPYFDIRLPCGSGLDIVIQPFEDHALIRSMHALAGRREPFALRLGLEDGSMVLDHCAYDLGRKGQYHRTSDAFIRLYNPPIRCLIVGSSPIAVKLAELSACSGFETRFYASDADSLPALPYRVAVEELVPKAKFPQDAWTAAILAFHDHEKEIPVLSQLLRGPCFFITAIGSRGAQAVRASALQDEGFTETEIARLRSPAGLVPGLKSAPLVALSILAQAVAAARERGILS